MVLQKLHSAVVPAFHHKSDSCTAAGMSISRPQAIQQKAALLDSVAQASTLFHRGIQGASAVSRGSQPADDLLYLLLCVQVVGGCDASNVHIGCRDLCSSSSRSTQVPAQFNQEVCPAVWHGEQTEAYGKGKSPVSATQTLCLQPAMAKSPHWCLIPIPERHISNILQRSALSFLVYF